MFRLQAATACFVYLHRSWAFRAPETSIKEEKDIACTCSVEEDPKKNNDLEQAQILYDKHFNAYSFIGDVEPWFTGAAPNIDNHWESRLMLPQLRYKHTSSETAKAWSNPSVLRCGDGERLMPSRPWQGNFWSVAERADAFTSEFGRIQNNRIAHAVVAKSSPILGIKREGGTLSLKVGRGFGTVPTSFRKGRCSDVREDAAKMWERIQRAPANVFLTAYYIQGFKGLASTRKQVRHGTLAFKFGSKKAFLEEAAKLLRALVTYALESPFVSPVPRVRFTQLMAPYPRILEFWIEPEAEFVTDQTRVIELFRQDLVENKLRYGMDTSSSGFELRSENVVEFFYASNAYATPGRWPFHEDMNAGLNQNLPGLFTYFRWIIEDAGTLVQLNAHALSGSRSKSFFELGKKWAFCSTPSARTPDFESADTTPKDWISKWLSEMVNNTRSETWANNKDQGARNFKCWNRQMWSLLEQVGPVVKSTHTADIRRLQDALDVLYQLVAQRKEHTEDVHACGRSKLAPGATLQNGCPFPHRTAELLQLSVLDNLLGIAVTFSSCKSGLDRTGIYHAVQSATDQLFMLYPECGTYLAYLAIHFTTITVETSRIDMTSRRALPDCSAVSGSVLPQDSLLPQASWRHLYNLFRNAVLKNMLEVGVKVTHSSTGVPGLKFGGHGWTPNPMVAPFLPPRVRFRNGSTLDAPSLLNTLELTRETSGELYIANDVTLGHLTATTLIEDASQYRAS